MFASVFKTELDLIARHLDSVLKEHAPIPVVGLKKFWECMEYSLLSEGKRFRPLLSLLTAKALGRDLSEALPLASAVELIHTYSLIHDDLPVMDNDDMRRGRPTNHKVYGDAQALLAGDALLTLAFFVLASSSSPNLRTTLGLLAKAAGPQGMVGGQVLDIAGESSGEEALRAVHALKTGALIRVAVEGSAVLLGAQPQQRAALATYGTSLGFAFQLADDLQDYNPNQPEKVSYVTLLGVEATQKYLQQASHEASTALKDFDTAADGLRKMVQLNIERV